MALVYTPELDNNIHYVMGTLKAGLRSCGGQLKTFVSGGGGGGSTFTAKVCRILEI